MAKIIMIQGTSSGVGKSTLALAICRIFKQNGLKVAPFKSQNMSSKYHTLENGHKMARAQAIMAYSCGIKPTVDMNPILIIPNKLDQMEVILWGKSIGNMNNFNYAQYKQKVLDSALKSFYKLYYTYDIIVVEGAGSPVEMNLIKNDIVNMGLAEIIKSPVILISDISRGGVFASLYGTIKLFTKNQRSLIKGIVINKFMGDVCFFDEGKKIIEKLCKKPVLGVVPYRYINIEDEDNLTDFGLEVKSQKTIAPEISDGDNEEYMKFLNIEFDHIAQHFRSHLDIDTIFSLI